LVTKGVAAVTNTIGRFWAIAVALVVFFVLWAVLAAKPWVSSGAPADPRLSALQAQQQQTQNRAIAAQQTLNRRWAAYRSALMRQTGSLTPQQQAQIAAAPAGPSVLVKVTGATPVTHSTSSRPALVLPAVPGVSPSVAQTQAASTGQGGGGNGGG
jgi:ABC-type transport system involved in cytochrome bd biosynthesis fused ATPase/permease subunit